MCCQRRSLSNWLETLRSLNFLPSPNEHLPTLTRFHGREASIEFFTVLTKSISPSDSDSHRAVKSISNSTLSHPHPKCKNVDPGRTGDNFSSTPV
jgi:hypothetical protein